MARLLTAFDWPVLWLDLTLRASVLLAGAWCGAALWRRSSAAQRHLLWTAALIGLLGLPVLEACLPGWAVRILPPTKSAALEPAPIPVAREADAGAVPYAAATMAEAIELSDPAPARPDPAGPPVAVMESAAGEVSRPFVAAETPPMFVATLVPVVWAAATFASLFLVIGGTVRTWRFRRGLRPIAEPSTLALAEALARAIGLRRLPALLESESGTMPLACGAWRPWVVLPADAAGWPRGRLRAVLLHELAHVRRRDCLTHLVGRLARALYWFQPLAWLALRRMDAERERACDDIVLAAGLGATDYSAELVGMARVRRGVRPGGAAALPMARRSQLEGRVRAVLDPARCRRPVARRLAGLMAVATAVVLVVVAGVKPVARAVEAVLSEEPASQAKGEEVKQSVDVTVRDKAGKPVAGATVYWIGYPRPALGWADAQRDEPITLARRTTDTSGRLRLSTEQDAERFMADWTAFRLNDPRQTTLIAKAPGMGLAVRRHRLGTGPAELVLLPEVLIEGQLLTPSGTPAAGVTVHLDGLLLDGRLVESPSRSGDPVPMPNWPAPVVTDGQGRFALSGLSDGGGAHVVFRSTAFAWGWVFVSAAAEPMPWERSGQLTVVKPRFTHVLAEARIAQGRVTAKDTGKPIAGARVAVAGSRRDRPGGGGRDRTDKDGRYRVLTPPADYYRLSVGPPTGSAYLPESREIRWPQSGNVVTENVALASGRILSGRVVDRDTGRGVAGASVVYRARGGNKHSVGGPFLSSQVLTDDQGRSTMTGLAGEGYFVVECPSRDYARVRVSRKETKDMRDWMPHGCVRVDVPEAGDVAPVDVPVHKGVTIVARAVRPDGGAIPAIQASWREANATHTYHWGRAVPFEHGLVRIPGCEPGQSYRVLFLNADLNLGAAQDLVADAKAAGPVEVRLQPTASLRGRVVFDKDTFAAGVQVKPIVQTSRDPLRMNFSDPARIDHDRADYYDGLFGVWDPDPERRKFDVATNPQGEFLIDRLIPAVQFYLIGEMGAKRLRKPIAPLAPGEERDLGTLTLREGVP